MNHHLRIRRTLPLLLVASAAVLAALSAPARADVAIEGYKNVPVTATLDGIETIAATHDVLLVTLTPMDRDRFRLRGTGLQGALDLPHGYREESMLVAWPKGKLAEFVAELRAVDGALPDNLAALSDADAAAWLAANELAVAGAAAICEKWFRNPGAAGVAVSDEFEVSRSVPDYDPVARIERSYRVTGVETGRILLEETGEQRLDADGQPSGTALPPVVWWVLGGIGALLGIIFALIGFRRQRREPIPDDAI